MSDIIQYVADFSAFMIWIYSGLLIMWLLFVFMMVTVSSVYLISCPLFMICTSNFDFPLCIWNLFYAFLKLVLKSPLVLLTTLYVWRMWRLRPHYNIVGRKFTNMQWSMSRYIIIIANPPKTHCNLFDSWQQTKYPVRLSQNRYL
jgi:hypothetical protein